MIRQGSTDRYVLGYTNNQYYLMYAKIGGGKIYQPAKGIQFAFSAYPRTMINTSTQSVYGGASIIKGYERYAGTDNLKNNSYTWGETSQDSVIPTGCYISDATSIQDDGKSGLTKSQFTIQKATTINIKGVNRAPLGVKYTGTTKPYLHVFAVVNRISGYAKDPKSMKIKVLRWASSSSSSLYSKTMTLVKSSPATIWYAVLDPTNYFVSGRTHYFSLPIITGEDRTFSSGQGWSIQTYYSFSTSATR